MAEARSIEAADSASLLQGNSEVEDVRPLRPGDVQDGRGRGLLRVRYFGAITLVLAALALAAWCSSRPGALRGHKTVDGSAVEEKYERGLFVQYPPQDPAPGDGQRDRWDRGCANWEGIMLNLLQDVSLEACREECRHTEGCVQYNYQPGGCQTAEARPHWCFVFGAGCQEEDSACWNLYQANASESTAATTPARKANTTASRSSTSTSEWGVESRTTEAPSPGKASKKKRQGKKAAEASRDGANRSTTTSPAAPVSDAPLFEFYMYRANSKKAKKYEFGNINTGNLDGVVWYLMNEVVTMYTSGSRCPRKFNISQINRYKVRTRATRELFATGINFGTRYSYDFGQCMGRCFPDNMCTGTDDCDVHFDKFGFNVGCNKFADMYPFPDAQTPAPQGIWYALPLEGRCDGEPTGAPDCTWSYEDAGAVDLEDIEAMSPYGDNCCPAERCTGFWDNQFDEGATSYRVQQVQDKFQERFPEWPRDLGPSQCDFYKDSWYTEDTDIWEPHDPWESEDDEKKDDKSADDKGDDNTAGSEEWRDDSYNK